MTREERELSITYLEGIKEEYIEGEEYERHPLPEYYAIECAIETLKQESVLDRIKGDVFNACSDNYHIPVHKLDCDEIFEIINKYEAESEEV